MAVVSWFFHGFSRIWSVVTKVFFNIIAWIWWVSNKKQSRYIPPITDTILLKSASELARMVRSGQVSSLQLVNRFITRIEEVNPHIQAVVYRRYDEARETAQQVDQILADERGESAEYSAERRPLLGVPFTVKEAFQLTGMPNSSGLVARKSIISEETAPCVRHLIDAGAIPVAGTNISELCMWWESSNNVYGRTCNPYDVTRMVGGSSGGEGSIISAGGSPFGVGADIGGSIRMPAFFNGVYGHKGTPGLVRNLGQWPPAEDNTVGRRLLATGPICRHAEDLPLLIHVMSRQWKYCDDNEMVPNTNSEEEGIESKEQVDAPSKVDLTKQVNLTEIKVISVVDDSGSWITSLVCSDLKEAQLKLCNHLEQVGAQVQHMTFYRFKYAIEMWIVGLTDMHGPSFASMMGHDKGTINPFWELFKWIFQQSNHTLPAILLSVVEKLDSAFASKHHDKIRERTKKLRAELLDVLDDRSVILYPSHPLVAPRHNEPVFTPVNHAYTALFNAMGFPVTQCPLGLSKEGLPLGIQVVAAPACDHLTLAVALEIERRFGGWHPPGENQ